MTDYRSARLDQLPPYLFVEIDRRKKEAIAAGRDVIDFGVGDPDKPTHNFIVDKMAEAIRDPANHTYALGAGTKAFRQTCADFFAKRYDVTLNPDGEVIALLGSKEAIGHLPTGIIDAGDVVLVPDPGYPVYQSGTIFAGGICHLMPLLPDRGWLPDLSQIPSDIRHRAKIMYLNYPNNPTSACATLDFFEEAINFAKEHSLLVVQDAAYNEMYFGDPPPSILQVSGAKETAIELHSFSKTFNMTGWRVGYAVGNASALSSLAKVKANMDSGVFQAVQHAAIAALTGIDRSEVKDQMQMYRRRRDTMVSGLQELGWDVQSPDATFYVWVKCPKGFDSMSASTKALDQAGCVIIPGIGFGSAGEGYVRFALTVEEDRIREALSRLGRVEW